MVSWHAKSRSVVGLALPLLIGLQAQDCPRPTYAIKSWEMPACPAIEARLPTAISAGGYSIAPDGTGSWCPGFRGYLLVDSGGRRFHLTARLSRGRSCRIQVAYSLPQNVTNEEPHLATVAARLLIQPFQKTVSDTGSESRSFASFGSLRTWCNQNTSQ